MFLQRLREYAERHPPAVPSMYVMTPIKWLIDLDMEGNFKGFVPTAGGEKNDRGKEYAAPHSGKRTMGIKPRLLADSAMYVLGIPREKDKPDRVVACKRAFREAVAACAQATKEPAVHSVLQFLGQGTERLPIPESLTGDDNVTFRIDGILPVSLPAVQSYWAVVATPGDDDTLSAVNCIVCGQPRLPVSRLPVAIKGIPGGQKAGMALISANETAYESYGLEASLIAPICHGCAESTHMALNDLLAGEKTSVRIKSVAYVAWTREETEFSPLTLLSAPDPESVTRLIQSVYTGGTTTALETVDTNRFYAAALTASGARVVVRDWIDTTMEATVSRLARYFAALAITDEQGEVSRPLGVFALAASTVRDVNTNPPHPKLTSELIRVALGGGTLSRWVLAQAVQRNRAERQVSRPRAALIKLFFMTQPDSGIKEGSFVKLDEQNRTPAYLCGRLLATLAHIQDAAISGANATLVDRYYGTASSAPGVVFGLLMRHAQAHLSKLRKEKPGLHKVFQTQLEEVQAGLSGFPATLSLEEQGLFALGYYHQRAERWKSRTSANTSVEEG